MKMEQLNSQVFSFMNEFNDDIDDIQQQLLPKVQTFDQNLYLFQTNSDHYSNIKEFIKQIKSLQQQFQLTSTKMISKMERYEICKCLKTLMQMIDQSKKTFMRKISEELTRIGYFIKEDIEKRDKHLNISSRNTLCLNCERQIEQERIEHLKMQLQIHTFEDKFNFYDYDHKHAQEIQRLKKINDSLLREELTAQSHQNRYQYQETCLSQEEFDSNFNHLFLDVNSKNLSIGNVIQQFHLICNKIIYNQQSFKQEGLEIQEALLTNQQNLIQTRIKDILLQFYHKLKLHRKCQLVDQGIQVHIKQNSVIKELQAHKKKLKEDLEEKNQQLEKNKEKYQNQINLKNQELFKASISIAVNNKNIEILQTQKITWQINMKTLQQEISFIKTQLKDYLQKIEIYEQRQIEEIKKKKIKTKKERKQNKNVTKFLPQKKSFGLSKFKKDNQNSSDNNQQSEIVQQDITSNSSTEEAYKQNKFQELILPPIQKEEDYELFRQKIQIKNQDRRRSSRQQRFSMSKIHQLQNNQTKQTKENKSQKGFTEKDLALDVQQKLAERKKSHFKTDNFQCSASKKNDLLEQLFQLEKHHELQINYKEFQDQYCNLVQSIRNSQTSQERSSSKKQRSKQKKNTNLTVLRKITEEYSNEKKSKNMLKLKIKSNEKQLKKSSKYDTIEKHKQFYLRKNKKSETQNHALSTLPESKVAIQNKYENSKSISIFLNSPQPSFRALDQSEHKILSKHRASSLKSQIFPIKSKHEVSTTQIAAVQSHFLKSLYFSDQQIISLYVNSDNIKKKQFNPQAICVNTDKNVNNLQQIGFMTIFMATIAQIRLGFVKLYEEITNVLLFPYQILHCEKEFFEEIKMPTSMNNLKESLISLFILHRKCSNGQKNKENIKKKATICKHLDEFLHKIQHLFQMQTEKPPSLSYIQVPDESQLKGKFVSNELQIRESIFKK